MELKNTFPKVYVTIDKVKNQPAFFSLDLNDSDFIRNNWRMLAGMFQFKDIDCYCLGDSCELLNSIINASKTSPVIHKVEFSSYSFDSESDNLLKGGLKEDEIEAYFAERSKNSRGVTEKQIVSIMENFIAQNKDKIKEA